MKWFAVTNRREKGKGTFNNEPQDDGAFFMLHGEGDMPPENRVSQESIFQSVGHTDSDEDLDRFVGAVKKELRDRRRVLREKFPDEDDIKPALLVYTHGYNNDWADAREELIQLRRNFHREIGEETFEDRVVPLLFSWPSEGNIVSSSGDKKTAYREDRDDARGSALAVKHMVHLLYRVTNNLEDCTSSVSVIAHSMGAYVFREALGHLTGSEASPAGTFVDQFILIGADIGNTSLEAGGKGYGLTRFSNRVSVYLSPHDTTLRKSKRKNGRPRLGRTLSSGYRTTPDNVVFVDCRQWAEKSEIKGLLADGAFFEDEKPTVHNCYRAIPALLHDQYATLCGVDREAIPDREPVLLNKHYKIKKASG